MDDLAARMIEAGWKGRRTDGTEDPLARALFHEFPSFRFAIGLDYFVLVDDHGTQVSSEMPVEYCTFVRRFDRGEWIELEDTSDAHFESNPNHLCHNPRCV